MRGAHARNDHPESGECFFLREAALGVADISPEDVEDDSLTLPLGISVWLARSGIAPEDACGVLRRLRTAFLEVSGLDRRTEPVPLVGGDPRQSVVTLARYLDGLVARASRTADRSRRELAEAALELLEV